MKKWFIPMAAKWPKSNGAKRLHGQSLLVAKELQVWLKSDQPCQVTLQKTSKVKSQSLK
jgi:hypothetical protein